MMNLASIDIGSNGARLLIKRFDPEAIREEDRIKKLMFIRIPLRLGKDVFTLGKVSKEREKMMLHMMKGFKQFMKLNDRYSPRISFNLLNKSTTYTWVSWKPL